MLVFSIYAELTSPLLTVEQGIRDYQRFACSFRCFRCFVAGQTHTFWKNWEFAKWRCETFQISANLSWWKSYGLLKASGNPAILLLVQKSCISDSKKLRKSWHIRLINRISSTYDFYFPRQDRQGDPLQVWFLVSCILKKTNLKGQRVKGEDSKDLPSFIFFVPLSTHDMWWPISGSCLCWAGMIISP